MFANFIKLNGFRLMAWVGQTVKRQSIESISKLMFCHVKSKVSSTLVWRNVVASLTISIVTHGESRLDALYYFRRSEQNSKTNQINFFCINCLLGLMLFDSIYTGERCTYRTVTVPVVLYVGQCSHRTFTVTQNRSLSWWWWWPVCLGANNAAKTFTATEINSPVTRTRCFRGQRKTPVCLWQSSSISSMKQKKQNVIN